MTYHKDLREHLAALEERGKLIHVKREINKDTEMWPLVRLQFRGLPEEERKGFLFENIVDARGRKYDIPVATCVSAGSEEIYAIGLMCRPEEIVDKWAEAQLHPIEPKIVSDGPVKEEVHIGDTLLQHGGLDEFPIPISTPGFDVAPYITSPCWVTKDPETGIRNVGTYRVQVKSRTRTGAYFAGRGDQHGAIHWRKCQELGKPLEAALVLGGPPSIQYVSVSKFSYETDEFFIAGGLGGAPVELVKCETVDLEVPAHAEIVLEGEISTTELELEAPFGEAGGYMGQRTYAPFFEIKCITHRRKPIWHTFLSQRVPSESGKIRKIGREGALFKQLRYDLNMPYVLSVKLFEFAPIFMVIQVARKANSSQVWQALEAAKSFGMPPKLIVAVNEDIYPTDYESLLWAIITRAQPHRDSRIVKVRALLQDHSVQPPGERLKERGREPEGEASCLLIDATLKWPYPPVSLPKKEYMERALQIWKEEGLPPLRLSPLWYGYNLGFFSAEEEEQAQLAVKGEYYQTGEYMRQRRVKAERGKSQNK